MNKLLVILICGLVLVPSAYAYDSNDFFGFGDLLNNIIQKISEFKITINIPEIKSDSSPIVIYSTEIKSEDEQLIELDNFIVTNVNKYQSDISKRLSDEGIESVRLNILSNDKRILKSYVFKVGVGLVDNGIITDYYYNVSLSKALSYIGLIDIAIPLIKSDKTNEELIELVR